VVQLEQAPIFAAQFDPAFDNIYMRERRKLTRTRVLQQAKMLLDKSSVIDCVARDLTNSGAGLFRSQIQTACPRRWI
jgi:hypothetical protein